MTTKTNNKKISKLGVWGFSHKSGSKSIRIDYNNGKIKYIPYTNNNLKQIKDMNLYTEYDKKTKRRIWF